MNPTTPMSSAGSKSDSGFDSNRSGISHAAGSNDRSQKHDHPATAELRENASDAGANLKQAASLAVPAAKEQVAEAADAANEKMVSFQDFLVERIQEKPINSLLWAAGIGLVVGWMVRR